MSKEIKWDKSESYVVNYHNGRQDAYYVLQIAFYNGKQDFKMQTDIFGYYLLVCNVPNFNPKTNELGEADIEYSDLRLLVPCSRRGEKSFKLALDMMDKEARESIEVMEEDKIFLEEIAKENDIDVEEMKKRMKELKDAIENVADEVKVEKAKKEEKEKKDKKKITFDDIAGLEDVKEVMRDVIDQFKYPEKYEHFDIPPYRSLMLHGKPGVGKTYIANAFANEMDAKFIKVSLGEIGSKYQNATSNNITNLFKDARKEEGNVILLLDEVDSLASKRGDSSNDKEKNNTLNTLLQEMSSEDNENIFIICATNFYELLDPAFCRVGRIDVTLEIPLPNFETRLQILELNTKRKPLGEDVELTYVSEQMEGKNCADVAFVCNQAARIALKKDKMEINQEDFVEALEKMNVKKEEEKVKKIGFALNK